MERNVSLSVIEPPVEILPGVHILPWQLELLREEAAEGPQLTARAERYIGLLAHAVLYGDGDGTEIQEEGLEDRISKYYETIEKYYS
ncbi:hypothetical protein [Microcoleus phage My-WqHQDG]|nr:hypothetical protein [Microcoleus phage My-WqHQDG]